MRLASTSRASRKASTSAAVSADGSCPSDSIAHVTQRGPSAVMYESFTGTVAPQAPQVTVPTTTAVGAARNGASAATAVSLEAAHPLPEHRDLAPVEPDPAALRTPVEGDLVVAEGDGLGAAPHADPDTQAVTGRGEHLVAGPLDVRERVAHAAQRGRRSPQAVARGAAAGPGARGPIPTSEAPSRGHRSAWGGGSSIMPIAYINRDRHVYRSSDSGTAAKAARSSGTGSLSGFRFIPPMSCSQEKP